MRAVVLVSGHSGHGKDAVANMIAEMWGKERTFRCALADPVKSVAKELVGMPREVAYGSQAVRLGWTAYGKTAREALQIIGTEIGREMFDQDIWIDRLVDRIVENEAKYDLTAVSDVRFWNEVLALPTKIQHRLSPAVKVFKVMVWRPNAPTLGEPPTLWNKIRSAVTGIKLMHKSEAQVWEMRQERTLNGQLSRFDHFLVNDKGLDHLRLDVSKIVDEIRAIVGSDAATISAGRAAPLAGTITIQGGTGGVA